MNVHFVVHESFEAPGAILDWALDRGHSVSYTRIYEGDRMPESVNDIDFLVVMGGPQSPYTTKEECPYYDAQAEVDLISKAVEAKKYVFGVCLGAQLIGQSFGGQCVASPNREIGVFPLRMLQAAKEDPIFANFPEEFLVGHWHGDMPGLTEESVLLAESDGCPRQIVRFNDRSYGFQCHFEFTPEVIELMIENSTEELEKYADLPYVESAEVLRAHDYAPINQRLFEFLDRFVEI